MRTSIPIAAAVGLLACGTKGADTSQDTAVIGDASAGATVFANTCAACHGADGSGIVGNGPSLYDQVPVKDDAELQDIITQGYGSMPPETLSDQQIADLIAYLRATFS